MRVFLSLSFVLSSLVALAQEVPPAPKDPVLIDGLEKIGTVKTDIFSAPTPGRLIVKVTDTPRVLIWEEAKGQVESLYDPRDLVGPYSIHYATSPSAKYLLIKEERRVPPESLAKLFLYDLVGEKVEATHIGETRSTSLLPVLAPDDSKYLLFGLGDSRTPSGWTFPLSEYLSDLKTGAVQPTGFYMNAVPSFTDGPLVKSAALSPDATKAALVLAPDPMNPGRPIADGGGPGFVRGVGQLPARRSIRILDIESGKFDDMLVGFGLEYVMWPTDDILILKSEATTIAPNSLYKFTISEKKVESIDKTRSLAEEVSPDGRWLIYIPVTFGRPVAGRPSNPYEPGVVELVDLTTMKHFKLTGVSSATFSPDSQTLMCRTTGSDAKPFVGVALQPFLGGSAPELTELGRENPVFARTGFSIDQFAIPSDPDLFNQHFEVTGTKAFSLSPAEGYRLEVTLRNKSDKYFGIPSDNALQLRCQLVDETGKTWASHFPTGSPGVRNPQWTNFTPGETRSLSCPVISRRAVPLSLKMKLVYSLHKNERALSGELNVP